jgi:hypothetical protein
MASPTHPVSSTPPPAAAAPSSANAITAGAVASSNAPSGLNASSKISSLADLKKKAPELYKKMLEGIGMSICNEMQHHQDRLKELMREGNNPPS